MYININQNESKTVCNFKYLYRIYYAKIKNCGLTCGRGRFLTIFGKMKNRWNPIVSTVFVVGVKRLVGRCPTKKFDCVRLRRESFESLPLKTKQKNNESQSKDWNSLLVGVKRLAGLRPTIRYAKTQLCSASPRVVRVSFPIFSLQK